MHKEIEISVGGYKEIFLTNVSPKLLDCKNSELAIPGSYHSNRPITRIAGFHSHLVVLQSKRRPRKLTLWGDDEKMYQFALKGGEDLRQDERVMQLLNLVNNLLRKDEQTEKRDLRIITFPVIPLTTNTGILGWVQNCDTLQE